MRWRLRCLVVWAVTLPGTYLGWPLPSERTMDWCDRQLNLADLESRR